MCVLMCLQCVNSVCWRMFSFFLNLSSRYWEKEVERRLEGDYPKLWWAFIKLFWLKILLIIILCGVAVSVS